MKSLFNLDKFVEELKNYETFKLHWLEDKNITKEKITQIALGLSDPEQEEFDESLAKCRQVWLSLLSALTHNKDLENRIRSQDKMFRAIGDESRRF